MAFGFRSISLKARQSTKLPVDQFVGTTLAQLRAAAGVSEGDVAQLLGILSADVVKFECGRKRIRTSQLFVLAEVFDVPVAAFFGWGCEAA